MELGKIYQIRHKNDYVDLDLYKIIKKYNKKIKFAKLKIPIISAFGVSKIYPKILSVSQDIIYRYEYDISPN